jgi:hypothetical protein
METLSNHLLNNARSFKPPNAANPEKDRQQEDKNSGTQKEFSDRLEIFTERTHNTVVKMRRPNHAREDLFSLLPKRTVGWRRPLRRMIEEVLIPIQSFLLNTI